MRLIYRFTACFFLLLPLFALGQKKTESKIPRVLILLDGSSSMLEDWGNSKSRFKEAERFVMTLMDSMNAANDQVEFGLRVFGHQYPAQQNNCYDTKREVMFARGNNLQMQLRLQSLKGMGVSPIAYALSEAANEDFENENKYAYSIILITDGGESCGGDICKVVNDLLQRKIFFKPYIVSLVDYAPLRNLYACLGNYLSLTKENELPNTVNTIVDGHREGFERAKTGKVIDIMNVVKTPEVVKPEINPEPVNKPEPIVTAPRDKTVIRQISHNRSLKPLLAIKHTQPKVEKAVVPGFNETKYTPEPKPKEPEVVKKVPEVIKPNTGSIIRQSEKLFAPLPLPRRIKPFLIQFPLILPSKLPVSNFVQSKNLIQVPLTVSSSVQSKNEIAPKETTPTTAPKEVKPKEKPSVAINKPKENQTRETTYSTQTEPAAETLIEVYFTDGQGKFYQNNPQILLKTAATGKLANRFYRTVDANGNPDPQKAAAGTYDLNIAGSDKTFLKNLVIQDKMKNKVIITVSNGSLHFSYSGINKDKPVDKYYAIVKRNFDPLPTVQQRCDTDIAYPPGNYHIEINTIPVSIYSIDLSFGTTQQIPIPEPGIIKINNINNLGKVRFFAPHGDKFQLCYSMNITGNPESQTVEVNPGIYEVHYSLTPGTPEKVHTFHVISNTTYEVELK